MAPRLLTYLLLGLFCLSSAAQPVTGGNPSDTNQPPRIDWQVEIVAFIHPRPDQAFRDRQDLSDYRDLPALPALLTAAEPEQPNGLNSVPGQSIPVDINANPGVENPHAPFATELMAGAWRRIAADYQRVAYFRWRQPPGRGALRRLHDDQPLTADDSLSLGPHFEFDGRIRVTTATIGYANLQMVHRTPLLINPGFSNPEDQGQQTESSRLWRTLTLEQQRRIQPGRMEYFDSAGLGLLILITPPQKPEQDFAGFSE